MSLCRRGGIFCRKTTATVCVGVALIVEHCPSLSSLSIVSIVGGVVVVVVVVVVPHLSLRASCFHADQASDWCKNGAGKALLWSTWGLLRRSRSGLRVGGEVPQLWCQGEGPLDLYPLVRAR